ncbi:hypothetical protein WDZ55_22375 [Pseudomonas bubulae]|uniref:hypothetical protein n=1 Tax=Pseudomonas bubulae TaxID=2316085 RepID=UPI00307FC2C1
MATRVFGPGVEPGGMDLDDNHDEVQCPACKGKAIARYWEACEGGAINAYNNIHCTVCGHFEGDTGEGDKYDHLFESCHDENFAALRAEIEAEQEAEDREFALASLDWLTMSDFRAFAAGIRQAA